MGHKPRVSTVALYLAERLASLGAKHVFAVPGDYVAAFLDAVGCDLQLMPGVKHARARYRRQARDSSS